MQSNEDGVSKCIKFLSSYKINFNQYKENLIDLQSNIKVLKAFEKVPQKTKYELIKRFNGASKTSLITPKRLKGKVIFIIFFNYQRNMM